MLSNMPIRRKLITMLLLTSGTVLLLTCVAFIVYETISFRQQMLGNIATVARVVANNSTAALAFANQDDARDVLAALKAEPQIVAAALYDADGALFATYPQNLPASSLPAAVNGGGYRFAGLFNASNLSGAEPVVTAEGRRYGTLYIKATAEGLYTRLRLYSTIAATMTALAFLLAYLLSRFLQRQISGPVLHLAEVAEIVQERKDFSVRARKLTGDELGTLTDSFNRMLEHAQQHELTLRDSEARVRAVLNSALSAVIVIDQHGHVTEWNARAEAMFGWQRDEALGREMAEMIIPETFRAAHRRGIELYLNTGNAPVFGRLIEMTALRRDGEEFPVELSISAVGSGATVTFCGFITDITERKQAQRKLQAQLARLDLLHRITGAIGERQDLDSIFQVALRSLEDNLPLDFGCICLYDPVAHSLTVNNVGARSRELATTLAMAEHANIPIDRNGLSRCVQGHLVYEPDIAAVDFPFPRRLAGSGLRSMVAAPLRAESRVFGVLIAASRTPHRFSSNDCEFLQQLSQHVALAAHQAQLYTALQAAYDELRQSQHTILQQERLRALGQMASGVAHDINNAISPVSLYTESLLAHEQGLSERARGYLVTIQKAIEDVAKTVSRMREFYRPKDDELSFSYVDLNRTAQDIIELTEVRWRDVPQQSGAVVELKTEFAENLPGILGATNEIRDAITNLVFNAVDAMPEGGTLTLRTFVLQANTPEEGATVVLEVADTGVGMSEETKRRCLEPFFTTKGQRGTGLGLAMVYGMIQRHGAQLQIDSTPGTGTVMRLAFASIAAMRRTTGTPAPARQPPRARILLVDDDPLIIESLREILQRDGHKITTADGGQAGIDAFGVALQAGQSFDVVITDLGMPYVDGRRVAAAVKQLSPITPVILLTGWGQRLVAENDVPSYVDRVINKPPKLIELRRVLAELLPAEDSSQPS